MVRAAARGLLTAAVDGGNFWRRFALIAEELEREAEVAFLTMRHRGHLALVPRIADDATGRLLDAIDVDVRDIRRALFPYLETDGDGRKASQKDVDELVALWDQTFGDHKDPAVQAKIQRLADYLDT